MIQNICFRKNNFKGINPLVTAATPLLLLMIKLKDISIQVDITTLHGQIIEELGSFNLQAKALGCDENHILAARYCICASLDEVVLLSPWSANSIWIQQTMLSIIHKETWGGERFFVILEKMAEKPGKNRFLLELLYIILSFGFEGKYYGNRGAALSEVKNRLFNLVMEGLERNKKL